MADEAENVTKDEQTPVEAEAVETPAEKPAAEAAAEPATAEAAPAEAAAEAPAADAPSDEAAEQTDETSTDETPAEEDQAPAPERAAPAVPADKHYFWGTGRRKKAIARVRIRPGTGQITLNKRDLETYFTQPKDRNAVLAPLQCVGMIKAWDIWANISGGGFTGQAGAVKLGLARALATAMPDTEHSLRAQGLLTRDARMVERKKPGQKGARKRFQFSKR